MNWAIAMLLFLTGANVASLIFPFSFLLIVVAIVVAASRPVAMGEMQALLLAIAVGAAIAGIARAVDAGEIGENVRQIGVILTAAFLAGSLGPEAEDVLDKFLRIFAVAAGVGLICYVAIPDWHPLATSIGDRSYLIGPSSTILDREIGAPSSFGSYRFQGLLDEPGTYGVFAATAAFVAWIRHRRATAAMLFATLILSESVGGGLSLIVLVALRVLTRASTMARIVVIATIAITFAAIAFSSLGATIQETFRLVIELRTQSGQVRGGQIGALVDHWKALILPNGYATGALLAIVPHSITVGIARSLVSFGVVGAAGAFGLLAIALRRSHLATASGALLAGLVLAGLSRSGVFDLLIGWFVVFVSLRQSPYSVAAPRLAAA